MIRNIENLLVALIRLYGAWSILTAVFSLVLTLIMSGQPSFLVFATNVGVGVVVWLIAKPLAAVVVSGLEDE